MICRPILCHLSGPTVLAYGALRPTEEVPGHLLTHRGLGQYHALKLVVALERADRAAKKHFAKCPIDHVVGVVAHHLDEISVEDLAVDRLEADEVGLAEVAAVALANKIARIAWAVLSRNTTYQAIPA